MKECMKFMADWGLWDILGLLGSIIPLILILRYLFPQKAIDDFYIHTHRGSANTLYPKVIVVELRNHTNESIYVYSRGFVHGTIINASPHAARDTATGVSEVKFEGRKPGELSDIDTLVRPNQVITTWIPVNPTHADQEIDAALEKHQIGILRLTCKKLTDKRNPSIKLEVPV